MLAIGSGARAAKGGGERELASRKGRELPRERGERDGGEVGEGEECSAERNEAKDSRRCWSMSRGGREGAPLEER